MTRQFRTFGWRRTSARRFNNGRCTSRVHPHPRHVEIRYGDNFGMVGTWASATARSSGAPEADRGESSPRSPTTCATMGMPRASPPTSIHGAGTIEFLLDTDGQFYFMEMNTRIREHPSRDGHQLRLVKENPVAAGEPISFRARPALRGTIECRINAEDRIGTSTSPAHHASPPGARAGWTRTLRRYTVPPYETAAAKSSCTATSREADAHGRPPNASPRGRHTTIRSWRG